jgi:hypothetical protein
MEVAIMKTLYSIVYTMIFSNLLCCIGCSFIEISFKGYMPPYYYLPVSYVNIKELELVKCMNIKRYAPGIPMGHIISDGKKLDYLTTIIRKYADAQELQDPGIIGTVSFLVRYESEGDIVKRSGVDKSCTIKYIGLTIGDPRLILFQNGRYIYVSEEEAKEVWKSLDCNWPINQ